MADDPQNQDLTSDMLDQSEIDRLLAQAGAEAQPALLRANGTKADAFDQAKVEHYDFRNPVFLTEFELRRLRLLHEDFIRYLSARLSLFLRMECAIKMSRLQTQTYTKFTEGLPNPTHICLFKTEPLTGVGVLDINPRLALTLVDRMLGGRGHSVKAERYLTEIEIALLEDILAIVLEEWCAQWKGEQELHPQMIGHENNGRFLQTSPRDSIVLALGLEVSFGDCSEQLQIGVPYYMIEPLVRALQARRQKDATPATPPARAEWRPIYENVTMPVRAEWALTDLPLREVATLRVGDVIQLPADIVNHTRVLLNGTPKFVGTVGIEGENAVVKLSRKLTAADESAANKHGRRYP
ncbi:MAG TPA: FliM/FliN family flagellar motor switch protein [Candidatus Synoicihabitans sp.]|nr:FliM/FliN family flagellar motor switch protein [Candidatus Synoicihabitans sp.]